MLSDRSGLVLQPAPASGSFLSISGGVMISLFPVCREHVGAIHESPLHDRLVRGH